MAAQKSLYTPDQTLEQRELAYRDFVYKRLKFNYAAHFVHGAFGMTGFRLVNAPTFVPAYLYLLSGSSVIVGLGLALQQAGGVVSGVLGAAQIEHRPYVLRVSVFLGLLMRLQILGLALAGFFLNGKALLGAVLFFLFMFGVFSGQQGVVFQFLLAKVIPLEWRGRLQGLRNMFGGLVAALLAYWAGKYLIGGHVLGNGYSATFLAAFVLTSVGLAVLAVLIKEPDPPTLRRRMPIVERMREFPALLRGDTAFFYYMVARTFAVAGRVASPFYIIYAAQVIKLDGPTIGLLTFSFLIASTVSNLLWGPMSDRIGFHSVFVVSLAVWIGSTLLLMAVTTKWFIVTAFFGLGSAAAGYMISSQNLVLEFGHRDDMAMRLALSNTSESLMSTLGPLGGGVIAALLGYAAVFWTSILFLAIGLALLVLYVDEPRRRAAAAG